MGKSSPVSTAACRKENEIRMALARKNEERSLGSIAGAFPRAARNGSGAVTAQGIANREDDVREAGEISFASGRGRLARGLQNTHDVRRGNAGEGGVNGSVQNTAVLAEDEDRREGDAAFFSWIEDAPVLDHLLVGIAENVERQTKIVTQRGGLQGRIDGNGNQVRAGGANFIVVRRVIRQLAEAEGSPIAAEKEKDEDALRR
jgi:hypothetical protein